MRFHCGISFSWRSIKKFLIPILLGILAYFGFNFINDNSIPLGFIKVNALEDSNSSYISDSDSSNSESEFDSDFESYYVSDYNEEVVHKPLFNNIFWLDDNTTEIGILTSIYELLLIYCLSMMFLKIFTIIKNTRW